MKLSTKMRYGTRAMLELALHRDSGPISLKEIAERQGVSPRYLAHLMSALQSAGLARAIRGAKGGYQLSALPDQVTLRQIFDVLEGSEGFVDCTTDPQVCDRFDLCATQEVWAQMYSACMDILTSTTLADLARRLREKQEASAAMYHI